MTQELDELIDRVVKKVAGEGSDRCSFCIDNVIAKLDRLIKTSPFHQHDSSDTIPAHNVEPDV